MSTRTRLHIAASALGVAALGFAALTPSTAQAHRAWMLPSATVVSGDKAWVTIDAAVSNDLFYFEHFPLRLDDLKVFAPDGTAVEAQNKATGRYRSTFDIELNKPGTWRVSTISDGANASFKENGQTKRVRGTLESLRKEIPAGATDVSVTRSQTRMDVFVTSGKLTDTVLKPTGAGLEMVAYTHPNDLVAGDEASFGLIIDGKPAAGVPVTLIPGGIRYRNQLGEINVVTDNDGKFKVTWPEPGMYWLNANYPPRAAGADRSQQPTGTLDAPAQRAAYTATLEVLAP